MKNLKWLSILILLIGFSSCSIQISPAGEKESKVKSKCNSCFTNGKYFKGSGTRELDAGPGIEDAATRQALDFARQQLAREIATEAIVSASKLAETVIEDKRTDFKENVTEFALTKANEMITDAESECDEAQMLKNGLFRVKICLRIKKEDFNNKLYKDNYEFFANAGIDYENFKVKLSGKVVKK